MIKWSQGHRRITLVVASMPVCVVYCRGSCFTVSRSPYLGASSEIHDAGMSVGGMSAQGGSR
jgi:hypothetical protein